MSSRMTIDRIARALRGSLLAGACVALVGCTFLVDWSSLHEGDRVNAEVEGEGGAEVDTDGGVEADGVADAGAEVAPGSFCRSQSPTPTFCDSFDDGSLSEAGWTIHQTGVGALSLDGNGHVSAPFALLAQCPACDPDHVDVAYARTQIPGMAPASISLAFDVRLEARKADEVGAIASLETSGGRASAALRFLLVPNGAEAEESFTPNDGGEPEYNATPLSASPAIGEWTRVEMRVDLTRPARATVKLNGTTVLDDAILQFPFDNAATRTAGSDGGVTGVRAGIVYATGTWRLRVDNVVHLRQ